MYRLGIDVGGMSVKAGIVDDGGAIIKKAVIPTGRERHYSEVIADIAKMAKKLIADAGLVTEQIKGIGVGTPGSIDGSVGTVVYSNNIAWTNVPLGAELARLIGLPVKVDNDANVAGLGEFLFGGGKKYSSSILLTLGTGIGAGIILDGKVFSGFRGAGAELGHTTIMSGGEPCNCGRKGCLEAHASATALLRDAARAMAIEPASLLNTLTGGKPENLTGEIIFAAKRDGDPTATRVIQNYINYLAEGIINFVNAFRPEVIIIGGGVGHAGEALLAPLREIVAERIYGGSAYAPCDIIPAILGNDAGIIGAAFL